MSKYEKIYRAIRQAYGYNDETDSIIELLDEAFEALDEKKGQ